MRLDISKYRKLFLSESDKLLGNIDRGLLRLEQNPEDEPTIEELFRWTHSMKGMSLAIGYRRIGEAAHAMEDLLAAVRDKHLAVSAEVIDVCLKCQEGLRTLVEAIRTGEEDELDLNTLLAEVESVRNAGALPPKDDDETEAVVEPESRAERPLRTAHQATPASAEVSKASAGASKAQAEAPSSKKSELRLSERIVVDTEFLDECIDAVGELLMVNTFLRESIKEQLAGSGMPPALDAGLGRLRKGIDQLHEAVNTARMTPLSALIEPLPRLVRQVARDHGKEVELRTEGTNIGLDRQVLDRISAPLLQLVTNCVIHGIEDPEARVRAGKSRRGVITVAAERRGPRFIIDVRDDGGGLDPRRIRAVAVSRGLIAQRKVAGMSDEECLQLICLPGFTTSRSLSQNAGRGVGMPSVKQAIEEIGGELVVEGTPGTGASFRLHLPMSLSITGALVVESRGQPLAVPVSQVVQTTELPRSALAGGRNEQGIATARIGDREMRVFSLGELLRFPSAASSLDPLPIMIAGTRRSPVAFTVDRFVGQQYVVAKPLGEPLQRIAGLSGVTILGDGRPTFILDMPRLVQRATL